MSSVDPDSDSAASAGPGLPAPASSPAPSQAPPASNANILIFGLIMLVGIMFLAWVGRVKPIVTIGRSLPQLDLQPLLEGTPPVSSEKLLGKITVLHFWGTWCPPCIEEFPAFVELASHFADNPDVVVVSVSCSQGPEYELAALHDKTLEFMAARGAQLPTYSDSSAMTRQQIALILPNGTMGYPTTLLVDREGKIFELLNGYYPGDMEKLIPAIEGKL